MPDVAPSASPARPSLTAIAAVARNGVIGDGGAMLWHLPDDFARFKRVTMGGVLVMGRRTYESLGGALPGRTSIVLTRDAAWRPAPGVLVAGDVAVAVAQLAAWPRRAWWSIGGGQVYRAFWPYTTHLDLTLVKSSPEGAVTFPDVAPDEWAETGREVHEFFDFVTYERRSDVAAQALRGLVSRAH